MKTKKAKNGAALLFEETVAVAEHVASLTRFRHPADDNSPVAIVFLDAERETILSSAYGGGANGLIANAEREARTALDKQRATFSGEILVWKKRIIGSIGVASRGHDDHRLAREARSHFYNMRTGHRHRQKGA